MNISSPSCVGHCQRGLFLSSASRVLSHELYDWGAGKVGRAANCTLGEHEKDVDPIPSRIPRRRLPMIHRGLFSLLVDSLNWLIGTPSATMSHCSGGILTTLV